MSQASSYLSLVEVTLFSFGFTIPGNARPIPESSSFGTFHLFSSLFITPPIAGRLLSRLPVMAGNELNSSISSPFTKPILIIVPPKSIAIQNIANQIK